MRTVKVIFKNDVITTEINGTEESITKYYKSNYFNVGRYPSEDMQKAKDVIFLD